MIISNHYKYAFISVPKTGTHTMYDVLTKHFHGERYGGYHEHQLPKSATNYFKFCTVRNPYHKFASAWSFILNNDAVHRGQITELMGKEPELLSFLEWLLAEKDNIFGYGIDGVKIAASLTPLNFYFKHRLNNMKMDAIIQIERATEQFNNSLPFVNRLCTIPKLFSTASYSGYKTWDELKTPEVTEMVNEWAGSDFEQFGYYKES